MQTVYSIKIPYSPKKFKSTTTEFPLLFFHGRRCRDSGCVTGDRLVTVPGADADFSATSSITVCTSPFASFDEHMAGWRFPEIPREFSVSFQLLLQFRNQRFQISGTFRAVTFGVGIGASQVLSILIVMVAAQPLSVFAAIIFPDIFPFTSPRKKDSPWTFDL